MSENTPCPFTLQPNVRAYLTNIHQKKIVVAMSGGVDSSVSAALLKRAGARVRGVFMLLAQPDQRHQAERARQIAEFLDIPLEVVDLREPFRQEVLDSFAASYFRGETPNPCVVCNRVIKCGRLLEHVLARSADLLATGHYARIAGDAETGCRLLKGRDAKKDQSYFLCRLTREQLSRLVFPLGSHTKTEVYGLAAELGLAGRHGSESQDVCFLRNQPVSTFLEARYPHKAAPGPIITLDGREVGRHAGIHRYTVGQRRGLGIPAAAPYYVIGLDPERKAVLVGGKEDLFHRRLTVRAMNWISGRAPKLPGRYAVKIRYRHEAAPARVDPDPDDLLTVSFDEPQRAITPGQFAALYDGDEVLGGGEIDGVASRGP